MTASAGSCVCQAPARSDPRHTWHTHPSQHPAPSWQLHLSRADWGFYTSEAQGHLWIKAKHSTALVWERFCALQMQGSSNGGNWSYCSCFPQSWHQVGMFLSTPHCEVQEKSNPTTLISLCSQIVFKEHERSKAPLGSLSLFPVKAAAAALTLGAAQLRFLTPCQ